ncbi:MAG: cob(I)yrinic acid a,c-diamide adenosyltransferase [Phycisphaerae bacterium]|nr:cob(I)yrinic acid a,c-diamide adenosyltransferase [Phycisphaerae bacterium]
MAEKGLVQIYTGSGKGKTTAALGLALRAAGWGKSVIIYQFLKPPALLLGERKAIAKSKLPIKIEAVDVEWDMPGKKDKKTLKQVCDKIEQTCKEIQAIAKKGKYDLIILDEIIYCLSKKLVSLQCIKNIIKSKKSNVEIILTGRGATKELINLADLVTEMKEVKHPFRKNIKARKGMEY